MYYPDWIPIDVKLPQDRQQVLCTTDQTFLPDIMILEFVKDLSKFKVCGTIVFEDAVYKGKSGFVGFDDIDGYQDYDVSAWIPLPQSYKKYQCY